MEYLSNNTDIIYNIIWIILGWLLGIISPWISNYIANEYKRKTLISIIKSELTDIKHRLAWIPFQVLPKYSLLTEDKLIWIRDNVWDFLNYPENSDSYTNIIEYLKDEGKLKEFLLSINSKSVDYKAGFGFKKIELSLIDSNQINFFLLDTDLITGIIDIKYQINTLNEEIWNTLSYLMKTYDSTLTEENYEIITEQIKRNNIFIADRAQIIVNKINLIKF